jgi:hypothetical protein
MSKNQKRTHPDSRRPPVTEILSCSARVVTPPSAPAPVKPSLCLWRAPTPGTALCAVVALQSSVTITITAAPGTALKKLLCPELSRITNGRFKPLLDPGGGFTSETAVRKS